MSLGVTPFRHHANKKEVLKQKHVDADGENPHDINFVEDYKKKRPKRINPHEFDTKKERRIWRENLGLNDDDDEE